MELMLFEMMLESKSKRRASSTTEEELHILGG